MEVFSEEEVGKILENIELVEMDFYHKDEFVKQFKSKWLPKFDFPLILSEKMAELELFLSSEKLNEIER